MLLIILSHLSNFIVIALPEGFAEQWTNIQTYGIYWRKPTATMCNTFFLCLYETH